ncbi:hypothetical protein ES319_A11G245500v1 [Gossypium barbadense]|uniref:Uncharacterized protein n=2 Tax=Gossypium TaxID=3633 RepID=A0A5J5TXB5_GOSBA|nr:hypothetical protein ES319_A11G245500v1 [Gossypium barbadense]TYG95424.1 hypothetical protein ES288_A11G266700v1 [Gossypium darwinii]
MSEAEQANSPKPPPYLEVLCKSSGKKTRFAAGTKAGFAVSLINRKLGIGAPVALHIESFREGEEPIIFGPDAVLVNYGNGWNLQTVNEMDFPGIGKGKHVPGFPTQIPNGKNVDLTNSRKMVSKPGISFLYIAKVLLAFVLMFMLAGVFMLALDNLPKLILLFNSSM